MNYKRLILALTALAFFFSCNVREESLPLARRVSFQAVVADNPSSKTVLQGDGSVYWSPMDSISLFYGELGVQLIADNTEPVATATFSGALDGFLPDGTSEFWAVYPYDYKNTFDGQAVTLVLPDRQAAQAGTYAPGLFPSMARSTDYTLQFYNLCGGVKFSVASEGIESVIFKGNNGEILAGQVQAAFDAEGKPLVTEVVKGVAELQLDAPEGGFEVGKWYYIVSLPVTLSAGYTMTFLSNNEVVAERTITNSITIKRSIWGRITEADNVNQPDNQIWYTSTDGEVVNPYDATVFGASLVSNKYTPEKGVITFDGPVTSVGNSAFLWSGSGNAWKLTSIRLPETVTSIGDYAFFQSSNLLEINIPGGVTSIGNFAFLQCRNLPSIELPQSLTSIGQEAFLYCHALTTVDIPSSVTSISSGAFAGCSNLESFTGNYASADGRALIVGTEMKAFAPAGLTSYKIPYGVTTVSNEVFRDLENLEEVIFPEGILSLGGAFYYCYGLKTLTIPSTVTSMYGAFLDACTVSDALYVLPTTPPTVSANNIPLFRNSNEFPIYVPAQSVEAYKTATGWSDYADRIQAIPGDIFASKYLTFTSEGTTKISLTNNVGNSPVLYYSTDTKTWTQWDYSELTFTADSPLYICGDNPDGFSHSSSQYSSFVSSGSNYSIEGSIMSLLNKEEDIVEIPSNYCFINLFKGCEKLVSGPSLPATSLKNNCYSGMFQGCSSLTVAPDLPATNLTVYCYHLMFSDCTALSFAPILSSTSLGYGCYESMFMGCTGLMEAPELPATFLTGLCYESMFQGCTALTAAPDLPATTLTDHCYAHMFWGCSNLESAPVLPATVMETYCYQTMFYGCTGLTEAPELPGLSLADGCYNMMFAGCTGLSEAPLLPAATLVESCYSQMFYGCSNLSRVECRATDISASSCLYWWLGGTASQGVFVKSPSMNDWPSGISGIPEGWEVEDAILANNYLTFTSQGTSRVYLSSVGGGDQPVLYYSYDSIIWESWDYSMLTFTADTPLYLCGDNPEGFSFDVSAYSTLGILGDKCTVSGDVMSLLDKDEELTEIPTPYCFAFLFGGDSLVSGPDLTATTLTSGCYYGMFQSNSGLTSTPLLPAVTLAENCYANMFYGCTGLTAAPELPAATLASSCYANMFNGCTGLTSAPSLSATELAYRCYYGMFQDCASLLAAPSLPATTMAEECYYTMFQGCSKLETAPELSATTLATGCYMGMFSTCTSLTEAPELPAITLAASCYYNMFAGCTKLVTAPELPATTLEYSCYAGMFSGCTSLTEAPVLSAQSLENMCYASLFTGCTSLNYVKCLATENMGGSNTGGWLSNVAATGTFVKAPNAQWESGMSGIPEGWEVVDDDGTSNSGHEGTDQGDEHLWG